MVIALFIVMLFLALVIHESSHAVVMINRGIKIGEFGIGFPSFLPKFRLKISRLPQIVFHPLLIGAYVKPDLGYIRAIERLSYKSKVAISGAGILANLLCSLIFLVIALLISDFSSENLWLVAGLIVVCLFLWYGRNFFLMYLAQTAGMAVFLAAFITPLVKPRLYSDFLEDFLYVWDGPASIEGVCLMFAKISFGLAIFNLFPLGFFDGGRLTRELLENKFGVESGRAAFSICSVCLGGFVIVYMLVILGLALFYSIGIFSLLSLAVLALLSGVTVRFVLEQVREQIGKFILDKGESLSS